MMGVGDYPQKKRGHMPVRPKSKRIAKATVTSKTGVEVETCWCRKCMEFKKPGEFFVAVDLTLDSNGFMSVCKECIDRVYAGIYESEHSVEKALLRTCRLLNVRYDENAVKALFVQLQTIADKGKETDNIFGLYKSKLLSVSKTRITERTGIVDMTFSEPAREVIENMSEDSRAPEEIKDFWGKSHNWDDLQYLEKKYNEWSSSHDIHNHSEKTLLKYICLKELQIEKYLNEERDISHLVKELQDLLKTAALTPAMANAANSGKNIDTFGKWIADIERTEPAEWLEEEGHNMYHDVSDVEGYFQKYFVRPLKNLMLQSKDFNIDDSDIEDLDDDEGIDGVSDDNES